MLKAFDRAGVVCVYELVLMESKRRGFFFFLQSFINILKDLPLFFSSSPSRYRPAVRSILIILGASRCEFAPGFISADLRLMDVRTTGLSQRYLGNPVYDQLATSCDER